MRGRESTSKRTNRHLFLLLALSTSPLTAGSLEKAQASVDSAIVADKSQVSGGPSLSNLKRLLGDSNEAEKGAVVEAVIHWWNAYCTAEANAGGWSLKTREETLFPLALYSWLMELPHLNSSARVALSSPIQAESGEDVLVPLELILRLDALVPASDGETLLSLLHPIALKAEGHVAAVAVSRIAKRLEFKVRLGFIERVLQSGGENTYSEGARVGALEVLNSGRKLSEERETWVRLATEILHKPGFDGSSLVASELESVVSRSAGAECPSELLREAGR